MQKSCVVKESIKKLYGYRHIRHATKASAAIRKTDVVPPLVVLTNADISPDCARLGPAMPPVKFMGALAVPGALLLAAAIEGKT